MCEGLCLITTLSLKTSLGTTDKSTKPPSGNAQVPRISEGERSGSVLFSSSSPVSGPGA